MTIDDTTPDETSAPDATDDIVVVSDLCGAFESRDGDVPVLDHVSFSLARRKITAIVGETGSGKTMTALAMLGLSPRGFKRTGGSIVYEGTDLTSLDARGFKGIRGAQIAMVFQDSRSALNPVFTIGTQVTDACRLHRGLSKAEATATAEDLLARVRVPEPKRRMGQYPHELSGGTVQRIQLALALACRPRLLLLDEPTTGLDVTIQADILELILDLTRSEGMTTCIITHDLGVVAELCDIVVVMRSGQVREIGTCEQIMTSPSDPYTQQLLAASRLEVDA